MKKRYVIQNTPIKFPFVSTVLYSFLLYYFEVNPILWGVFITLYSIYWIICIMAKINEVSVDLTDDFIKTNHE